MDELVKIFYIDWRLLIAQIINFCIVLLVLYFFAMKPLMKLMKERSQKIENGIKNSELMEERLKDLQKERQKIINEAKNEAAFIILQAEKDAEKLRQEKIEKTRREVEKMVNDAKLEIDNDRKKMLSEVKSELGNLILITTNKMINQVIDEKKHHKLIEDVLSDLKNVNWSK